MKKEQQNENQAFCQTAVISRQNMNRKTKFRAWNEETETMVYEFEKTDFCELNEDGELVGGTFVGEDWIDYKFMQSTNLIDKNKNEIFEGDILRLPNGSTGIVEWMNGGFVLKVNDGSTVWQQLLYHVVSHYSILGNVFQHNKLVVNA